MDQETAKRLFISALTRLDTLLEPDGTLIDWWRNHRAQPPDDQDLDYSEMLDALGEHLWGCHDMIEAPESALEMIGVEPGATYHEAVLERALDWLSEEGEEHQVVQNLHAVFVKDQQGRYGSTAPMDRETFRRWLHDYLGPDADALIKLWKGVP
jgi:hypothetical protein